MCGIKQFEDASPDSNPLSLKTFHDETRLIRTELKDEMKLLRRDIKELGSETKKMTNAMTGLQKEIQELIKILKNRDNQGIVELRSHPIFDINNRTSKLPIYHRGLSPSGAKQQ